MTPEYLLLLSPAAVGIVADRALTYFSRLRHREQYQEEAAAIVEKDSETRKLSGSISDRAAQFINENAGFARAIEAGAAANSAYIHLGAAVVGLIGTIGALTAGNPEVALGWGSVTSAYGVGTIFDIRNAGGVNADVIRNPPFLDNIGE